MHVLINTVNDMTREKDCFLICYAVSSYDKQRVKLRGIYLYDNLSTYTFTYVSQVPKTYFYK